MVETKEKCQKREKILSKINKILAKTKNNPSQAECETAFLLAQELLVKHGLTMEEIDSNSEVDKNVTEDGIETSAKDKWWHASICNVVADNFKCKRYINVKKIDGALKYSMRLMGFAEDIQIAKSVYQHVLETIEYQLNMYYHKIRIKSESKGEKFTKRDFTSYKNSYLIGYRQGLEDKFAEQVAVNNWGLVVIADKKVEEKFSELNLKSSRPKIKQDWTGLARSVGYKDGKNYSHIRGHIES
jgi:hypothetical protein